MIDNENNSTETKIAFVIQWNHMQILKHIFPLSIVAAIVEETIFCVHGGLSPDTYNPETVSWIKIYK